MLTKEKFWIEFHVCSDLRDKIVTIKLDESDLNINKRYATSIESIINHESLFDLLKNKLPIHLKDAVTQLLQEIKIESNPIWLDFLLSENTDKLFAEIWAELGIIPKKTRSKLALNKSISAEERIFYKELVEKASISKLDKAIATNERKLGDLVYLFNKQTILRNPIFFDLFQHWFDRSGNAGKIDELIDHLKRKANIKAGRPLSFADKKVIRNLIHQYEYLRRVFSKIKNKIKGSLARDSENRWQELEKYLKKKSYFSIRDSVFEQMIKRDWFKKNIAHLREISVCSKEKKDFDEQIKEYKESRVTEKEKIDIKRKALINFIENSCRPTLSRKKYYDLELAVKSVDYSFPHLYKKYELNEILSRKEAEQIINEYEQVEHNKLVEAKKIDIDSFLNGKKVKFISRNYPTDIAAILLARITDSSPKKIQKLVEKNKQLRSEAKRFFDQYPLLK